jgi:hypothetical protein
MEYPTRVVRVSSLMIHTPYPIIIEDTLGDSLLIYFLDSPDYISQTLLPYAGVYCSNEDLAHINSWENFYTLVYRGRVGVSDCHVVDFVFEPIPIFVFQSLTYSLNLFYR